MAEHDELVGEMLVLETMGTQERQKLAKKRRLQQLKRWSQREKEWIAKEKQLNKRLANIMSEENNGLNLKQYTTYNSNQRTKKKLVNANNNNNLNGNNNNNNRADSDGNAKHDMANQSVTITNGSNRREHNNNGIINGPYSNKLQPNGRVHFNVGVMLLEAAARNDYDEVKRLLSLGVSPDSINHDGLTALHQCCIDASEPIMQLLLDFGAIVDARDTEQWTPLHAACTCGHLNLVRILVEHGADLLAVNGDGNMPFDICEDEATLDYIESQMVKQDITQEMIDLTRASTEMNMLNELEGTASKGGDLNEADEHGVTRLHIAATNNYLSAVKFLLNHGVNPNVCDNDQWQPMHGVACWGSEQHIKIVELLVEAGASLDARTLNDETVFDLCDNVELLERMNQLKDELESKQATGTGRLRRTQSRTNSRVHSVRRTSVRDKNQISRREAREEALLRVDSTSETNGPNEASGELVAEANNRLQSGDVQANMEGEMRDIESREKLETNSSSKPQVTNLDEPDGFAGDTNNAPAPSTYHNRISPTKNHLDGAHETSWPSSKTETTITTTASQLSHNNSVDQPRVTGSRLIESYPENEQTTSLLVNQNSQQQQQHQLKQSHIASANVRVNVVHHQQSNGLPLGQPIVCDSSTPRQVSTTTVQVQFAPTNYTLSNLKKHRSDLRMRSYGMTSNGVSTTSLNNSYNETNQTAHQSLQPTSVNGKVALESCSPVMAARESVRLDPEPDSQPTATSLPAHIDNGHQRPESPGASFRKFHGQPSELFGGEAKRKRRHKCCIVV